MNSKSNNCYIPFYSCLMLFVPEQRKREEGGRKGGKGEGERERRGWREGGKETERGREGGRERAGGRGGEREMGREGGGRERERMKPNSPYPLSPLPPLKKKKKN